MDRSIIALQKLLNQYENTELAEDGSYGPVTANAVTEYLSKSESVITVDEPMMEPSSEHFSLEEYYSSGIVGGKKQRSIVKPPIELWQNIQRSMDRLEVLRQELGHRPIIITSGYRTPEYNAWLCENTTGVARDSPHMRGVATDIVVRGMTPSQVYEVADRIYPEGGVGMYDGFVHVDLDESRGRGRW